MHFDLQARLLRLCAALLLCGCIGGGSGLASKDALIQALSQMIAKHDGSELKDLFLTKHEPGSPEGKFDADLLDFIATKTLNLDRIEETAYSDYIKSDDYRRMNTGPYAIDFQPRPEIVLTIVSKDESEGLNVHGRNEIIVPVIVKGGRYWLGGFAENKKGKAEGVRC